jgi:hypothetical protein
VCTQVIKSSRNVLRSPPNPQFWGDMRDQSPPELGDLGGQMMSDEVKFDLCVHRSPEGRGILNYALCFPNLAPFSLREKGWG